MRRRAVRVLALLLLAGPGLSLAAPAEVRIGREPGRTRIVIDLPGPADYRLLPGADPRRIVFALDDATDLRGPRSRDLVGTPVLAIRGAAGGADAPRLTLELARDDLRIEHFALRPYAGRGHRLVIDLYAPAGGGSATAKSVAAQEADAVRPDAAEPTVGESLAAGAGERGGPTGADPGVDAGATVPTGEPSSAAAPGSADESASSAAPRSAAGPVSATAAGPARDDGPGAAPADSVDPPAEPLYLPGIDGPDGGGLDLRPLGYTELSAARTWPDPARWSKLRARLEYGAEGSLESGARFRVVARAETDGAYVVEDDLYPAPVRDDQRFEVTLREAYLDFAAADWDFRLGRQHVVWGEMVGLFLADVVSAKDTREFYLQDFEAIRLPQWALRAERFGDGHLELLWVPYMTYDNVGRPGANFYPFPGLTGPVPQITPERSDVANMGFGARYSRLIGGWDLSGFYYRSTDVAPTLYTTATGPELRHDRIQQFGTTFSKDLRGVVLKGEAVYTAGRSHISTSRTAVDGVQESDVLDYIVGVTIPRGDWNFDFQLYASHRLDHRPGMLYDADEAGATALVGYRFSERVEAQLLYLTGFNRADESLQGWFGWRFSPDWRLRAGVDWFEGEEIGFFGRYDDQDRVYLELKRWF